MKIKGFTYLWPERPQLLSIKQSLFDLLNNDPNWIAEPKINGSHLQLHFIHNSWQFWGRHGKPLLYQPDENLLEALNGLHLSGYWIFDGELRHNKVSGIRHKICLYDVFVANGEFLLTMPFHQRRKILTNLITSKYPANKNSPLTITEQYPSNFKNIYHFLTKNDEIEGLVLKQLEGKLSPGRKSSPNSTWMWKVRRTTGRHRF